MTGVLGYLAACGLRRIVNTRSSASHPAGLRMSEDRLRDLCPSLYLTGVNGFLSCAFTDGLYLRYYIRDMLIHGDSRAAVALSDSPLLVACYCDDLDGVCVLRFPEHLAEEHRIRPGGRLLTVLNSRCTAPGNHGVPVPDLVQGNQANPRYENFWPLVAEFLSDDADKITFRKARISEHEYARCLSLGQEHLQRLGGAARDGRPDLSMKPARIHSGARR